jgi:hypothetical protein
MLKCAVKARDAAVTSVLWMRLDEHLEDSCGITKADDPNRDPLGMGHFEFTHDLLAFLIFFVRQPKLLLAMIHDRKTHLDVRGHCPDDWRPVQGTINPRDQTTGIVAAVMDTVLSVRGAICKTDGTFAEEEERHCCNMDQLPRNAGVSWLELMPKLYSMLCVAPLPVALFDSQTGERYAHEGGRSVPWETAHSGGGYVTRPFTLLEMAVRCSESSCDPIKGVIKACIFTPVDVVHAFLTAIAPGVLRGDTMLAVVDLLLKKLAHLAWSKSASALIGVKEQMWTGMVDRATRSKRVYLTSTSSTKAVDVPQSRNLHGEHHPEQYLRILVRMAAIEDEKGLKAYASTALKHQLEIPPSKGRETLTYLVEGLLRLWGTQISVAPDRLPRYMRIENFISKLLLSSREAFDLVEPHLTAKREDGSPVARPDCVEILGAAANRLLFVADRRGMQRIMALFDAFPPGVATWHNLHTFVMSLCKQKGQHTTLRFLGHRALDQHYQEIKQDFKRFLELGKFSEELLRNALKLASKRRSTVAVEVLVSDPYCVKHEPDDAFVPHILMTMLAPGEREVSVEAGESFAKRQKVALAGEE